MRRCTFFPIRKAVLLSSTSNSILFGFIFCFFNTVTFTIVAPISKKYLWPHLFVLFIYSLFFASLVCFVHSRPQWYMAFGSLKAMRYGSFVFIIFRPQTCFFFYISDACDTRKKRTHTNTCLIFDKPILHTENTQEIHFTVLLSNRELAPFKV